MDNFSNSLRTWLNQIPCTSKTAHTTTKSTYSALSARDSVRVGDFDLQEQELFKCCSDQVQEIAQVECLMFNAKVVSARDVG